MDRKPSSTGPTCASCSARKERSTHALHGALHSFLFTSEIRRRELHRQMGIQLTKICGYTTKRLTSITADIRRVKLGIAFVASSVTGAVDSLSKVLDSGVCGCEVCENRLVRLLLQNGEDRAPLVREARRACLYPDSCEVKEKRNCNPAGRAQGATTSKCTITWRNNSQTCRRKQHRFLGSP